MSTAAILACALTMLGRSADSLPPIAFVDAPPPGASANVEAYVKAPYTTIYIVTSSPTMREADDLRPPCAEQPAFKKLASIIVHEEWHIRHGGDEQGAYEAQLRALFRLQVPPDGPMYRGVLRSMKAALENGKQRPDMVLVTRR